MFDQVYLIKTYSALADLYPRRESGVVENEAWKRILTISIRSIYETFGLSVRSVVNLYLILESIVLGHWHLLIVQTSLALGLFFMRLRGLSLN